MIGRLSLALVCLTLVAVGLNAVLANRDDPATVQARAATPAAGSAAKFAMLSGQNSNRCDLQRAEIMRYRGDRRLQGSCCSPMDEKAYRAQVEALRQYRSTPPVPRDPYDISAAHAQRLLRYDRRITLQPAERRVYRRGMAMSREKGPCCCACWRWDAFRGLSKKLIRDEGLSSRRLAALIEALDGCGGSPAGGHGGTGHH